MTEPEKNRETELPPIEEQICSQGLFITPEDEEILDRVWEEIPVTEEELRRKDEFISKIRPRSIRRHVE